MEKQEILQQLNPVFQDVLDNNSVNLEFATTARDIEEWDSLSHIQLIVSIERKFKIKFLSTEIVTFKSVGDLCDAIKNKLG